MGVLVPAQLGGGVLMFVRLPGMAGIVVGVNRLGLVAMGMAVLMLVVVNVGVSVGVLVCRPVVMVVRVAVDVAVLVPVGVAMFVAAVAVMAAVHGPTLQVIASISS